MMRAWVSALAAALLLLLALPALAQDEETVLLNRVYTLSRTLYCPVCPNETLDACRTEACARWREEIRQQMLAGQSDEQIVASFIARYGERVVGSPQDPLLRALAVATPFVLAALALIIGGATIWRWRSRPAAPASPAAAATEDEDAYRARIERDVRG